MSNNKNFKVKNSIDLGAYNKSIDDTAVDVFVYDTSKDSDGGAWRKRTQGTSWYNETLNTSTRGSRKEFPAVAVIVAESSQVTIYDGDDPDLPMWMVFNISNWETHAMGGGTNGGKAVTAVNGIICLANNVFGLTTNNFITETSRFQELGHNRYRLGGLANRNGDMVLLANLGSEGYLAADDCNDVAMTVLPNAPIDAATGLPVPTIAVATDGGVSVIKDDGTVVDITAGSYSVSALVEFTKEQNLLYGFDFDSNRNRYIHIQNIPTADINIGTYGYERGSDDLEFYNSRPESNPDLFVAKYLASSEQFNFAGDYVGGSVYGLAKLDRNQSDPDAGMVAFIDAEHNTGYQVGDIKLATLSDTDDTNVTGSELVTNGTFDSDVTGWTDASSNWSVTSGQVSSSGSGYLTQAITTVAGQTYTISIDAVTIVSPYLRVVVNGAVIVQLDTGDTGTKAGTFTATSSSTTIEIRPYSSGQTIDNISVRLAEEDRSVNGNGLQVFGTVTKSAVASGADLVAYGPFNTSNYFKQPLNPDLAFGSDDFCFMGWMKPTTADYQVFAETSADGATRRAIFGMYSLGRPWIYTTYSGDSYTYSNQALPLGVWSFLTGVRRNGYLDIYVNGELVTDVTYNDYGVVRNLGTSGAETFVGVNNSGANNAQLIALLRISATAPSPEQILKIYNDEKHLFTEGAQATLYGSSDSVTALAYDDSTELLHVGTSAGRSVFQGLRRVDNTEDAVGAAISASNNLIVEE